MQDIIRRILMVDERARHALASAEEKKSELLTLTKEKEKELMEKADKEAILELNAFEDEQKEICNQKLEEISNLTKERKDKITEIYNEKKENWEDEITNSILFL